MIAYHIFSKFLVKINNILLGYNQRIWFERMESTNQFHFYSLGCAYCRYAIFIVWTQPFIYKSIKCRQRISNASLKACRRVDQSTFLTTQQLKTYSCFKVGPNTYRQRHQSYHLSGKKRSHQSFKGRYTSLSIYPSLGSWGLPNASTFQPNLRLYLKSKKIMQCAGALHGGGQQKCDHCDSLFTKKI